MNVPEQTYICKVCGLHYEKEELAQKCNEFCTKHKACNTNIIKYSIEQQTASKTKL